MGRSGAGIVESHTLPTPQPLAGMPDHTAALSGLIGVSPVCLGHDLPRTSGRATLLNSLLEALA